MISNIIMTFKSTQERMLGRTTARAGAGLGQLLDSFALNFPRLDSSHQASLLGEMSEVLPNNVLNHLYILMENAPNLGWDPRLPDSEALIPSLLIGDMGVATKLYRDGKIDTLGNRIMGFTEEGVGSFENKNGLVPYKSELHNPIEGGEYAIFAY
tara:strand:+ start:217 stop:681 length:465 start_codon:yes stop_codon:yes gene_type:complete